MQCACLHQSFKDLSGVGSIRSFKIAPCPLGLFSFFTKCGWIWATCKVFHKFRNILQPEQCTTFWQYLIHCNMLTLRLKRSERDHNNKFRGNVEKIDLRKQGKVLRKPKKTKTQCIAEQERGEDKTSIVNLMALCFAHCLALLLFSHVGHLCILHRFSVEGKCSAAVSEGAMFPITPTHYLEVPWPLQ